jgi:hypothetical protein
MKQYFSDFFEVSHNQINDYGAFNISLISDLPLFIDPFLLFNSENQEYQQLHNEIINYLKFLRTKSISGNLDDGLINSWYRFPEIKQTWLGFAVTTNRGSGLGKKFADALNQNLYKFFSDFGKEQITQGSHLEKLCLISDGVGKDNISDFTTNLIHGFLLKYTQDFAVNNIDAQYRLKQKVSRVKFNYNTETWEYGTFDLPYYDGDYVLLTPKDLLTKDETWINKSDLLDKFHEIPPSISNDSLRSQVNNYFHKLLPVDPETGEPKETKKDKKVAAAQTIKEFPEIIDYYIRYKEDKGDDAENISSWKVKESERLYIEQFKKLGEKLATTTDFYKLTGDTYEESYQRILFFKDVVENKDGYRFFYRDDGKRIDRESDVQILYRLTWFATPSDINREVNNGRGPVDFKISRGNKDKSLIEFKLAKNTQLKRNLEKQVAIYEKANNTKKSIKVILYFSVSELNKVKSILKELKLEKSKDIVLIDARDDNKPSASTA